MKKQKLYGFWKHDIFPYCLGGEIEFIDDVGKIAVVSYQSRMFTPFLIVPLLNGLEIQQELNILDGDYSRAKKSLERNFKNCVDEIFKL